MTHTDQQGDSRVVQLHITAGGARRLDVAATAGHHITATVDDLAVEGAAQTAIRAVELGIDL